MKHKALRIIVGSFLTVISITLIAVILQWVFGIGNDLQEATTYAMAMVAPVISGTSLLFWGLPIYLVLTKFKKTKVWWYMLAGFIPAPVFVFMFKPLGDDPLRDLISQSVYFGVIGAAGAIIFWFYVVKMLHNKSLNQSGANNAPLG